MQESIELALRTWYPKDHELHMNPHHPLGKLLGEWGELLDDYMKSLYKPGYVFKPESELGDIWYYVRILCYQHEYRPEHFDHWQLQSNDISNWIATALYKTSDYFIHYDKDRTDNIIGNMIDLSYIVLINIASRYSLTLDDLTRSNWEKLKPGSERGEQWMKARVSTDYTGGKIGLK